MYIYIYIYIYTQKYTVHIGIGMMGNEPEIICGMVYSLVLACYVQNIPNDYDYLEKVYLDTADT